ncbi:hypothetical protein BDY24DRAFT_374355 [Mrakia frigida]|uniref:uncharacterized protein n=1 Tax=Mrakia frigida TaxID=29902 RepID=UPI003FCC1BB6
MLMRWPRTKLIARFLPSLPFPPQPSATLRINSTTQACLSSLSSHLGLQLSFRISSIKPGLPRSNQEMDDVEDEIPSPTPTFDDSAPTPTTLDSERTPTPTPTPAPVLGDGDVSSLLSLVATATASLGLGGGAGGGDGLEMRGGNPVVNFILGFLLITCSSIANSFGLNLMKFDHIKASESPEDRRPEYLRPLWLVGITSYIMSQLVGSTLALQYLRAEFVAPLGSSSLVFNFLIARWLVGTPVTKKDIQGTLLIVLGVILIIVFSSINSGLSTSLSLHRLHLLWGRGGFVLYFLVQIVTLFLAWTSVLSLTRILDNRTSEVDELDPSRFPPHRFIPKILHPAYYFRARQELRLSLYLTELTARSSDLRLAWSVGLGWASVGGALAGASLVFTKAIVMIGMDETEGKLVYGKPTAVWTLLLLAGAAVGQMIALNRGLKAFDSTLIVPVFYAGYTLLGFLNSMIFLDQTGAYSWPILICIVFSVAVLLSGVVFLSSKKEPISTAPHAPNRSEDDLESSLGGLDLAPHHSHNQTLGNNESQPSTPLRPELPRKRSRAGEEGQALFSADDEEDAEEDRARGGRELDEGRGKWEVGSDEDEDESSGKKKEEISEPSRFGGGGSDGGSLRNVWREEERGEGGGRSG